MFGPKKQVTILIIALMATNGLMPRIACADDAPPPDKSSYTLFNPVPDNLMRDFSTDRPTKSNSPYTVDAGHFQYEADLVSWTYDHYSASGTTASSILVLDPVLKIGLTQNTDLEFALAPVNIDRTLDRSTGTRNSAFGFGDVYTRVKFNLLGNEGGDYALAIAPYVKAPTANSAIGNTHWEGGAYMPFGVNLPDDWSMSLMTEIDILENADSTGTHANYQNMISFGHPLFSDNLTAYAEFWSDVNADQGAQPQYTFDLSLGWLVNGNWQLDGGVNIGLDKAAPDAQAYLGISQRF